MPETPQQYTQRILGHIDNKEPLQVQQSTPKKLSSLIRKLNKKQLTRRPAPPGKWSIAEILAHLADTELAGGWRMRMILSQNGTPVQAFDQDAWANTFNYIQRDSKSSLETFRVLRENLVLLKSVPKNLWENYGMHQERGKESIAHIVRMFAGHDLNHLQQIEKIVKESRR